MVRFWMNPLELEFWEQAGTSKAGLGSKTKEGGRES